MRQVSTSRVYAPTATNLLWRPTGIIIVCDLQIFFSGRSYTWQSVLYIGTRSQLSLFIGASVTSHHLMWSNMEWGPRYKTRTELSWAKKSVIEFYITSALIYACVCVCVRVCVCSTDRVAIIIKFAHLWYAPTVIMVTDDMLAQISTKPSAITMLILLSLWYTYIHIYPGRERSNGSLQLKLMKLCSGRVVCTLIKTAAISRMTLWLGNAFHIVGHLWVETTGYRWIHITKRQWSIDIYSVKTQWCRCDVYVLNFAFAY